jgi:hypothetical protein
VDVDLAVINKAKQNMERLQAERNLRFLLDNIVTATSTVEEV